MLGAPIDIGTGNVRWCIDVQPLLMGWCSGAASKSRLLLAADHDRCWKLSGFFLSEEPDCSSQEIGKAL